MANYYRIMQGRQSIYAEEAYKGNFIAAGFIQDKDLTGHLPDNWREFNKEFIPLFLEQNPQKTKIAAGLACGMLWTISKGIQVGDVVLVPNGRGQYYTGEITGDYKYHREENLPHRRDVRWFSKTISRKEMSEALKNATGAIGTVSKVSQYADEIEAFIKGSGPAFIVATDETIEDPSAFALEKHLEDFLVENWEQTDLGKFYDIYEEDGEKVGQQYSSDTGPIDILAISKDKKEILVIELKKGRASAVVVGQIQTYMGYVKEELLEEGQVVKGAIISLEGDDRLRNALRVTQNIDFYTYKISFKLEKK
jgi:restriction system protein